MKIVYAPTTLFFASTFATSRAVSATSASDAAAISAAASTAPGWRVNRLRDLDYLGRQQYLNGILSAPERDHPHRHVAPRRARGGERGGGAAGGGGV
eukprot:scaffold91144_cov67-Phaeocystis_antarctica.AAC.1